MNIKVNLQDGTPAQFKTEIIDGAIVVTVVEEEQEENLFPKWEDLEEIKGYFVKSDSEITYGMDYTATSSNKNIFTNEDLAKAALATARVSQTYRRYMELFRDVGSYVVVFGFLKLAFKDEGDFRAFCRANREDLDLISIVEDTVQL